MTGQRRATPFLIAVLLCAVPASRAVLAQETVAPGTETTGQAAPPAQTDPEAETAGDDPVVETPDGNEAKAGANGQTGDPGSDPASGPNLPDPAGAPPSLTATGFDHPGAHCRFVAVGDLAKDAKDDAPEKELTGEKTVLADPSTLFFTERRFDGFGTFERGYARINGLLRELQLASRDKRPDGETRRYRTLETEPVTIDLDFTVSGRTKTLTLLDGSITLARGDNTAPAVMVTGLCGPDAANRSVK